MLWVISVDGEPASVCRESILCMKCYMGSKEVHKDIRTHGEGGFFHLFVCWRMLRFQIYRIRTKKTYVLFSKICRVPVVKERLA